MRSLVRASAAALVTITVVLSSTLAFADQSGYVETGNPSGEQKVVFDDDPLKAGGVGPNDFVIHVPPSPKRVMLLRPRTQFVQEMLKSVESL